MTGESAIGRTTLSTSPPHFTVFAAPRAAPTRPPIRACVDDDGSPSHQVNRFQTIAPMSAAKTTTSPWVPLDTEMIPLPTVWATLVDTTAPTTFSAAAMPGAVNGRTALVEIELATAAAASRTPWVKANRNGTTTRR